MAPLSAFSIMYRPGEEKARQLGEGEKREGRCQKPGKNGGQREGTALPATRERECCRFLPKRWGKVHLRQKRPETNRGVRGRKRISEDFKSTRQFWIRRRRGENKEASGSGLPGKRVATNTRKEETKTKKDAMPRGSSDDRTRGSRSVACDQRLG